MSDRKATPKTAMSDIKTRLARLQNSPSFADSIQPREGIAKSAVSNPHSQVP